MRHMPSFVLLRAFEAAARLESFTLAARELHLTPSAVSHQMRELENYFGCALFVRRSRRVEPTFRAQRLFESLARVFDDVETACREMAQAREAGQLAVHCAPSFALKWLGPRLPAFLAAVPGMTIVMSSGAQAIDLISESSIDVAIAYGSAAPSPGVTIIPLGDERIIPMCSPSLLCKSHSALELLASAPLIESQLSRLTWSDWFRAQAISKPPRSRLSFDRAALSIAAAVDGMGIALESARLAERELQSGSLVELPGANQIQLARQTHFLMFRIADRNVANVRAFVSWIIGEAGIDERV